MSEIAPFMRAKAERDLINRGFLFIQRSKCCFCKAEFEWWKTPRGMIVPFTAADLKPHWHVCKRAFRNKMPFQGVRPIQKVPGNW